MEIDVVYHLLTTGAAAAAVYAGIRADLARLHAKTEAAAQAAATANQRIDTILTHQRT